MGDDLASKHYGILLFIRFMLLCLQKDATDRRLALVNSCNQKRPLPTVPKCSAVFFDGKIYFLNFDMIATMRIIVPIITKSMLKVISNSLSIIAPQQISHKTPPLIREFSGITWQRANRLPLLVASMLFYHIYSLSPMVLSCIIKHNL